MNYYLDTEFIEGFYKPYFRRKRHFIDLISIGIVSEDGREYYKVCKEFDLDYAVKNEWINRNVLWPIYTKWLQTYHGDGRNYILDRLYGKSVYSKYKLMLNEIGETRDTIAYEIQRFIGEDNPKFYAYFADYDWVVFCSLYGKMINLPSNYPMYCRDLKQMVDEASESVNSDFSIKEDSSYPIQETGEHIAIDDARWNKRLHDFLKNNYGK